jgi:hypothetical protein
MLELINAGLCLGPFCVAARMLVLSIVALRRRKLASGKMRPRATYGSVTLNTKFTFFCRIRTSMELRGGDVFIHIGAV